jgi:hypothetical protein
MPRDLWEECGLIPAADWDIDVDFCKSPFGRRVVVRLTHRPTGRTLEDTVVGSGLRKSDRDRWAADLVRRLARRMGIAPASQPTAPQVIRKRRR